MSGRAHAQHAESFGVSGTQREMRRANRLYVMGSCPSVIDSAAAGEVYVVRVPGSALHRDQSLMTLNLSATKEEG